MFVKKVIKNAIAYITRKKNRTFIIFVILTIVFSCLYSCLSIMKSSASLEKSLYKISNSSLSITKKDGGYFDINQFKDIEKLKEIFYLTVEYLPLKMVEILKKMIEEKFLYMKILQKKII